MERKMMESEVLEMIAVAAAATALLISCMKHLAPLLALRRWSATAPPRPLLFLLLHLTVASIILVSIHHQSWLSKKSCGEEKSKKWEEEIEAEDEVDAEELNARVEAFIKEFRRQLRIESFSSTFQASQL